jgi:hypothetical protein
MHKVALYAMTAKGVKMVKVLKWTVLGLMVILAVALAYEVCNVDESGAVLDVRVAVPEMSLPDGDVAVEALVQRQAEEAAAQERRKAQAAKIDAFLTQCGSPMRGLGLYWVTAAEKYSIDPTLSPAIAAQESIAGKQCFRRYNPFGMHGHDFSSWEEAIDHNCAFLRESYGAGVSEAAQCRGYCEGTPASWVNAVARFQEMMR